MPRVYVDTGYDAFDINIQMDDDNSEELYVKIISEGVVYSGRLIQQQKELLNPPDDIQPK